MKCLRFLAGLLGACIAISSFAQDEESEGIASRIYVKVYGGYGLFTPGAFKGISNNDNNDVNVVKVQKLGMGGGIRAGAGIGFIVNEYINLGIDGEYLMGKEIKVKVDAITGASIVTSGTTTYNHKVYSVIPNIVFKAISTPSYYVYNRIGLVIGIPASVTEKEQSAYQYVNPTAATKEIQQTNITTTANGVDKLKNSIGYQGAIGIQTKLGENVRAFFEVAVYGISFDRISYEDLNRQVVKQDNIKDMPTPPSVTTTTKYSRYYTKSGWTNYGDPTLGTQPQSPVNMNTVTAGIGLAYRF